MKRKIGKRTEIYDENLNFAIRVENLHKSFNLPTEQAFGLKQAFFNRLRGIKGYKEQKVLKGLNFEIKKGDFIGIVGRNGSGKSTLLKILAGIYYPQKGEITINGSLVPFIELGVGFNPELTGRENVYMNGALLGFSNEEMDKMYDDIWEFAELKDFQDQKLKNYSSGMQVRLAFSIAIRAKGDILLLDEVLAVGDAAFQQKCADYFKSLKDKNQTVILVTHSMDNVRKFCTRAILIDDGKIVKEGDPSKIADAYTKLWS
ncbi:ABC transporter ATP-binding protein [Candidatus Saccharibacteria bacterium]|nr:ABC transporter ATP-binding protein [Candidatus Saccharibacteria bacterium]